MVKERGRIGFFNSLLPAPPHIAENSPDVKPSGLFSLSKKEGSSEGLIRPFAENRGKEWEKEERRVEWREA